MSTARRMFFSILALIAAGGARLAGAAELRHDLYLCANLTGQSGVMGKSAASRSGLYRSRDREAFEHIGPHHIRMFTLTHDPREVSTLLVAALDGVLRTRDGGASWRTLTGWDMTEPKEIAFDALEPDHVYAGLPDGIAVSRDRGQTWRRSNDGIRRGYTQTITTDRSRAGRVLAGTELGIYLTEDGARTWRLVQPTEQTTYDLKQSPHDPKAFFAVTSRNGAFRSADGGGTWQAVAGVPKEHTLHYCDFDRHDARRLLICGWGVGVMVSEDGGKTWVDRTAGLPKREVWSAAFDPDIPGRMYAAPYLEALHASDDYGRTWRRLAFEKVTVYDIVFTPRP